MTVTVYQSTDASAPVLTGQVGKLVALLDACLVNGYGSKSAAGWTKAYAGTNTAIYKQGTGSNGFYYSVNDNAPATAQEARVCGFETASAAPTGTGNGTGTGQFPTSAQFANGMFVRKSTTADATARAWTLVADATVFYLFIDNGDTTNWCSASMFGDFYANGSSDTYSTLIIARGGENNGSTTYEYFGNIVTNYTNAVLTGHYVPRSWTGVGSAIQVAKGIHSAGGNTNSIFGGNVTNMAYPNGPDGGLITSPVSIGHSQGIRGYMKGIWAPCHTAPLNHRDTYSGTGNQAGKTFLALTIGPLGQLGQVMVETSNTWS